MVSITSNIYAIYVLSDYSSPQQLFKTEVCHPPNLSCLKSSMVHSSCFSRSSNAI